MGGVKKTTGFVLGGFGFWGGRRLVDVELSKEDVRKDLSLRILAQICKIFVLCC